MKLAIMQPYFFPYIGYFQCIQAVDKYILYDNVDYIRKGWMHRNRILIKYHLPMYINVPIIEKSSHKKIYEIQIDPSSVWKKKLLKLLVMNYKGSNYFNEVFPVIENLIKTEETTLFKYNSEIIKGISLFLDIQTEIVSENSNYLPLEEALNGIEDNNYSEFPELLVTKPLKKTARILKICSAEGAAMYINAIGGEELYSKEEFKAYGVELSFLKTRLFSYTQFSKSFHPHLSVIDVLMHNGKEGTKQLLTQYDLL